MPKQIIHQCSKEAEIAVMKNTLENTNKLVEEIHHRLLGNGQPGLIADVKALKDMKEDYNATKQKVDSMDKQMLYFAGGIAVLVFILSVIAPKIIDRLFGG